MYLIKVILEFAVVLGFMVLVHELGHFIVAKMCGVRVERFSIGMPPRHLGTAHRRVCEDGRRVWR
jgi:regulator of sigma E protease